MRPLPTALPADQIAVVRTSITLERSVAPTAGVLRMFRAAGTDQVSELIARPRKAREGTRWHKQDDWVVSVGAQLHRRWSTFQRQIVII